MARRAAEDAELMAPNISKRGPGLRLTLMGHRPALRGRVRDELPNGKSRENRSAGEGCKLPSTGIFTLLRPGTGALRGKCRGRVAQSKNREILSGSAEKNAGIKGLFKVLRVTDP